jgi:hypothetical protein
LEAIGNRAEVDDEERDAVLDFLGRQRPRPSFLRCMASEVVEGPLVRTVVVVVLTTVG